MAKRKGKKGQTTIYKAKDRVTRIPLKTGDELGCFGRETVRFHFTCGTLRVDLVTNPVIINE